MSQRLPYPVESHVNGHRMYSKKAMKNFRKKNKEIAAKMAAKSSGYPLLPSPQTMSSATSTSEPTLETWSTTSTSLDCSEPTPPPWKSDEEPPKGEEQVVKEKVNIALLGWPWTGCTDKLLTLVRLSELQAWQSAEQLRLGSIQLQLLPQPREESICTVHITSIQSTRADFCKIAW